MTSISDSLPPKAEFAFGESPFRAKGSLYLGTQKFFKKKVPGGLEALVEAIGPGPLADFIGQLFMPAFWYDALLAPKLIAHEAKVMNLSLEDYLVERTTWQVEQDSGGIYKFLLKLTSPRFVADRLPIMMSQMFDFCDLDVERIAEAERVAHFRGIPVPLESWLRVSLKLYTEIILKLAGAKSVDVHFLPSEPMEAKAGVARLHLTYRVIWT